ncbi:hypothetical protein QQS21_010243 [Conoideocrella luteorostrata]|uniref:Uncharacterized protein n=1 Tax=Conoideocrella luteorostrata TaxID=1105319 RepID=A0AAJ0FUD4_9HYPO|nr:hypothetical protein QQS21_010243 [Conoideocrella luteorostrata]
MVAVLGSYNGRMQSEWPHSININTLMALLGTALKACLVGTLADIISQSKWIWFYEEQLATAEKANHEKSNQDLQRAYAARHWRFSPAITPILSIAIGPFIQQAIKTETCLMKHPMGEKASLPVVFNLPGADSWARLGVGVHEPGVGLKGALVQGLTNPDSKDIKIEATCTTGNVTHSTLAMCSKCMDFMDLVKNVTVPQNNVTSVDPFNFTLDKITVQPGIVSPGNPRLAVGPINLTAYESHLTDEFKEAAVAALSNISVLTIPPQTQSNKTILCDRPPQYGQLEEQILSTTPATIYARQPNSITGGAGTGGGGIPGSVAARLSIPDPGSNPTTQDRTVVKSPCVIDDTVYTASNFSLVPNVTTRRMFRDLVFEGKPVSVPSDCYYTLSPDYTLAIAEYLDTTLLKGSCALISGPQGLLGCNGPFWLASLYKQKNLTYASLVQSFADVAAAAITFFRHDGWGHLNVSSWYEEDPGPRPSHHVIIGQPQQVTVCINLRWQWLLYTSILCILTITLFVWSLISTRRHREQPVWKSSLLPLLYLDFRPANSEPKASAFARSHTLHDLQQMSKTTSFKMDSTSKGGSVRYETIEQSGRVEEEGVMSPSMSSMRPDLIAPSLPPHEVDTAPLDPTSMMPRISRKPVGIS